MAFNKSGIIIDVTFTFDRLIKVLQKAPDDFFFEGELEPYLNKAVAKAAKEKIKKGNAGRALKPSTVEISKFTRHWKKDHNVPKRNFLPTREKLDIGDGQRFLTRKINRLMKKTGG